MISIAYKVCCDVCKVVISEQHMECGRDPEGALVYPRPSLQRANLAYTLLLCDPCWEPMKDALKKRIRELQEAQPPVELL